MCKCNPNIRTPFCEHCKFSDNTSPSETYCSNNNSKTSKIMKAIDEADLLFIDGLLSRPTDCDGVNVYYRDLSTGEKFVADINDLKQVDSYEEGYNG